jgi:hypothetical protein
MTGIRGQAERYCAGLGGVVAPAGDPPPLAMPPQRGFGGDGARCRLREEGNPDMPRHKISKNARARPATKPPATKTPQPKAARVAPARATSKQATVIALLRLNRSRVDQSVMSHNLTELQRAQAAAKTEIVEIETNTTRFTISGLNPEAAKTLRTFAQSCLDSEEIWLSPPAGTA